MASAETAIVLSGSDDESAQPSRPHKRQRKRHVIDLSSGGGRAAAAAAAGPVGPRLLRPAAALCCPVCFCDEEPPQAVELRGCGHGFCEGCISQFVRTKVSEGEVLPDALTCPHVDPRPCKRPIDPADVKACLRTDEDVERYERLTLSRFVESNSDSMGSCPTAGCDFVFEFDLQNRKLECPLCSKSFCLVCRAEPWHTGVRCEQFQAENGNVDEADKLFSSFASKSKLKQCPKCKFWVEKSDGCDAMHCRCNLVFCFRCGGVLKKGQGSARGLDQVKQCKCNGVAALLQVHEQGGSAGNHNNVRAYDPAAAAAARLAAAGAGRGGGGGRGGRQVANHAARRPPHAAAAAAYGYGAAVAAAGMAAMLGGPMMLGGLALGGEC